MSCCWRDIWTDFISGRKEGEKTGNHCSYIAFLSSRTVGLLQVDLLLQEMPKKKLIKECDQSHICTYHFAGVWGLNNICAPDSSHRKCVIHSRSSVRQPCLLLRKPGAFIERKTLTKTNYYSY